VEKARRITQDWGGHSRDEISRSEKDDKIRCVFALRGVRTYSMEFDDIMLVENGKRKLGLSRAAKVRGKGPSTNELGSGFR